MSKITFQDKTFLQELAELPEINKVTDGNINSIKKAINENGQYVSATESNGKFTCTLEGSISQNDTIHILFDTNSTTEPASLSVDGGNIFLNILDASGNSINASELSGQSVSLKNAGSNFEVETLNSYSSSKTKSYSANYVNNAIPTILDSLSSDSTTDAPSVHIVKDKFENMYKTASMTLEAGTTMQSGYTNKISLIGEHLVSISTRFQKQASAANAYTKLATIPEGYRPTTQVLFTYVNENGTVLFCYVDAAGNLSAYVSDTSKTSYSIVVSYTI